MYFLIVDKIDFSNNRIICNIIQNRKKELNEYIIEKALMKINQNYEWNFYKKKGKKSIDKEVFVW